MREKVAASTWVGISITLGLMAGHVQQVVGSLPNNFWTYHASKVVQYQSDLIFCWWNCNRTHMSWHHATTLDLGTCSISQVFILVKDAGAGDADGVYKPASRRWLEHDVYENRFGECIISREAQTSKSGQVKHGFLLAKKKHVVTVNLKTKDWRNVAIRLIKVDVFFAWYLCVAWISMSMAELPFESSAINFDNVKTTH